MAGDWLFACLHHEGCYSYFFLNSVDVLVLCPSYVVLLHSFPHHASFLALLLILFIASEDFLSTSGLSTSFHIWENTAGREYALLPPTTHVAVPGVLGSVHVHTHTRCYLLMANASITDKTDSPCLT